MSHGGFLTTWTKQHPLLGAIAIADAHFRSRESALELGKLNRLLFEREHPVGTGGLGTTPTVILLSDEDGELGVHMGHIFA